MFQTLHCNRGPWPSFQQQDRFKQLAIPVRQPWSGSRWRAGIRSSLCSLFPWQLSCLCLSLCWAGGSNNTGCLTAGVRESYAAVTCRLVQFPASARLFLSFLLSFVLALIGCFDETGLLSDFPERRYSSIWQPPSSHRISIWHPRFDVDDRGAAPCLSRLLGQKAFKSQPWMQARMYQVSSLWTIRNSIWRWLSQLTS